MGDVAMQYGEMATLPLAPGERLSGAETERNEPRASVSMSITVPVSLAAAADLLAIYGMIEVPSQPAMSRVFLSRREPRWRP